MHVFDKRPPFVRFEEREFGVDSVASEREGRPIPRNVVLAVVTPHGSKDEVEKVAEEWLEQIRQKSLRGEYPVEWSRMFRDQFEEWKKGNETPREGTPVAGWAMITKEQARRLRAFGMHTIEDLAEMPDTSLGGIGLDGRYLRDLARNWINEAKDKGINAKKLADAEVKISDQTAQIDELRNRLRALEQDGVKRGPGRPRKETDEAA